MDESRLQLPRQLQIWERLGVAAREGLRDRHRPEHEVGLRLEQGELHALSGQVAKREQRLQTRNPAARHDDSNWGSGAHSGSVDR